MKIDPQHASLGSAEVQEFRTAPGARWQIAPGTGRLQAIDDSTVRYTAPRLIWFSRTVRLTATANGDDASADIALSSDPFWIAVLSAFSPAPVLALLAALFWLWPGPPPSLSLDVLPPVVTIAPETSEQFSARILNGRGQDIVWSASDGTITPAGLFTAPKDSAGRILLTASMKDDPRLNATALVLIGNPLSLSPSAVDLRPSQSTQFVAVAADDSHPQLDWFSGPSGVMSLTQGRATVSARVEQLTRVTVTAVDRADARRQAAAVVYVSPPGSSTAETGTARDRSFIALVLIMGALGAFLGASRSFANFVGNRSFRPSWAVFYLFRPVFGAGLALLVFCGCRVGALSFSSTTAEPFGTAFLAGVVGLFADTVLDKLKDVISTMFPTRAPHLDKMQTGPAAHVS